MFYTSLVLSLCLWTLAGVFGDEVSVNEGDSVTLYSNLTEIQEKDEIEWWFKHIRIAKIKRSNDINPIYEDKDETQRFRNRLKMNNQTADLTITNITTEHNGCYELYINSKKLVQSFNLAVYASPNTTTAKYRYTSAGEQQTQEKNSDYKLLISVTVAAFAVGFMMSVLIFWIYRKHTNTHQRGQTCKDDITYADPTFYKRNSQTKRVKDEGEVVYAAVNTRS